MKVPASENYPPETVETQRRAIGWKFVGTANVVRDLHNVNLGGVELEAFLTPQELAAVQKLQKTLAACERNLTGLAKRCGVETR